MSSGSWGGADDSAAVSISDNTAYTIRAQVKQGAISAQLVGQSASIQSSAALTVGSGEPGVYSDKTNVTFDNFKVFPGWRRDSLVPRIAGIADAAILSGALAITGSTRGGEAIVSGFEDDYYMVTADVAITGSNNADLFVHYVDPNNSYKIHLDVSSVPAGITLYKVTGGAESSLASGTYTTGASVAVKIKVYDDTGNQRVKVWVDGTLKINTTDATHPAGRVAFGGVVGIDNLKIGYDNNGDDDLEDLGDDLVLSETFASTSVTVSHDHAGNLVDDGVFVYKYDAWNRLVLVRSSVDADVTIQTAEFDGLGRRMKKTVAGSGDMDGTTVYFYKSGFQICETRDGSGNMVAQFIHGTQYIDELVMMRSAGKGDLYIHQDANFNVIGVTDLGGSLIERYVMEPYGELTVHQRSSYGDRDGDGDVDATDKGTPGTTCTGTVTGACRILDLDFDGDYDSSDAALFDNLDAGNTVHPGRRFSALGQPFGHQGLWLDAEAGQYQNRARWYGPTIRRFAQRDPLGLERRGGGGYEAGSNPYEYIRSNPLRYSDPSGLVCGSGWSEIFPDSIPCVFDFTTCCQGHDDCYGDCDGPAKEICDELFCICMAGHCYGRHGAWNPLRYECLAYGGAYCEAVRRLGHGAFERARESCG